MRCKKANRLLSEKLDGMLSPRENAALAKHLDQCPACRRRLTDYMQLDAALADLEKEPPAALQQNIMAEIAANQPQWAPRQPRRFLWGPGTAVAAAAAVLLLLLGSGKLMLPPEMRPPSPPACKTALQRMRPPAGCPGEKRCKARPAAPDQPSPDLKQAVSCRSCPVRMALRAIPQTRRLRSSRQVRMPRQKWVAGMMHST